MREWRGYTDNRNYYYLKLKDTFFDNPKVILLEAMHDGIIYVSLLLKLYLKSLKGNGRLCLDEHIPYTEDMLAAILHQPVAMLHKALEAFLSLGLMEQLPDGSYYMSDIELFVGKSSTEADRKRSARQGLGLSAPSSGQMADICPTEIEKEIKLETEIQKERETGHFGKYQNVTLTPEEWELLKQEYPGDYQRRVEHLSEYMASSGKNYKNHLATIRRWAKQDGAGGTPDYTYEKGECL